MSKSQKKKNAYRKVVSLIDSGDIIRAKHCLSELPFNTYHNFFYRRIKEQELALDIKEKYLDTGRYALELQEYELAYDYFQAGKYLSDNPIFDYYLGKTFYKHGDFSLATNYFNDYSCKGSLKLNKCYFYLFVMAKRKNLETSTIFLEKCGLIDDFLEIDHKATRYIRNKKKKMQNKLVEEDVSEVWDEDFTFEEEEKKVIDIPFQELVLIEKLQYIKNLLLRRKLKEANKLLDTLKTNDKEERKQIEQLVKNKKLYLNKSK